MTVDSLSKWVQAVVVKSISAQETIHQLDNMFNYFDFRNVIVCDNEAPFASWNFKNWCESHGIQLIHSPPYHPQRNGLAMRCVQDTAQAKVIRNKYHKL